MLGITYTDPRDNQPALGSTTHTQIHTVLTQQGTNYTGVLLKQPAAHPCPHHHQNDARHQVVDARKLQVCGQLLQQASQVKE
jgi:hypothetical protein